MELIRTKILAPLEASGLISRPRLQGQLEQVLLAKLTLVQAPAGYGKTTLLQHWYRVLKLSGTHVGWLAIDSRDRSRPGLLAYIAAMLDATNPALGRGLQALVRTESLVTADTFLAAIAERLVEVAAPVFLFFDDVHLLPADAVAVLARLVECAPATTHLIMASREVPDLRLGRARAFGQLFEVGVHDLRFTPEEARSFLAEAGHTDLDESELVALVSRTEGWITGLKLASFAMRHESRSDFIASFSGRRRAVADFFAEGVFAAQSSAIQDFLLKTGVLERICPSLADAVTGGTNGREMLDHIESAGLFLVQLDDERNWYRYHSLFSDFLRRQLQNSRPDEGLSLAHTASRWFAEAGLVEEALNYARAAGDPYWLAELLEKHCEDLTYTGKSQLVDRFASHIPAAVLNRFPRTLLTIAWLRARSLRFEDTRQILQVVQQYVDDLEKRKAASADELHDIKNLLLHREMMLAAAQDMPATVEEQCRILMREFGTSRPYITCTLYGQLISACREQYKFGDLSRLEAVAQTTVNRSGYTFAKIALQATIGPTLFASGQSQAAFEALEQGLEEAIRFGGLNSGLAALPALPLSEIVYERNDLNRASQLVEGHLPVARDFGFVDQLISGYIIRPRLMYARGNLEGAFRSLDDGMNIALECGLDRLRFSIVAERIRILLRTGQPNQADELGRTAGLPEAPADLMPRARSTTCDEIKAVAWVRLALSRDRLSDAMALASRWSTFCTQRGAVRSLIRWHLLRAQIQIVGGDVKAAQRALREAITSAAPGRFVRSFIDEQPIHMLLLECYNDGVLTQQPTDLFAAEVIREIEPKAKIVQKVADEGLFGRLATKELEILGLAGAGMANREIGHRLGLTEGTVKWYMQQIYDKLGVRRRSQAVERARQFGLLN